MINGLNCDRKSQFSGILTEPSTCVASIIYNRNTLWKFSDIKSNKF